MVSLLCVSIILLHSYHTCNSESFSDTFYTDVPAKDVSVALLTLLGSDGRNDNKKIKELKEKLNRVDQYVIDREKFAVLLMNETKKSNLNATNFYKALSEGDHYRLMNDSRSLYLKLKERMNRDDLLQILSKRGEKSVMKYARRMMGDVYVVKKNSERRIDEAVDKYLGEAPVDDHTFGINATYNKIWDPQSEIEQRLENQKLGGRRIFKGERTTVRYYPFMVSIHVMGRFWCGGAIYWSDLILTSASCLQLMHNNRFFRENPKALSVRVGSNHSRIGGEIVDALEVYFNPGYDPRSLRNNIAVIRLVRHLRFDYHRIPKIIPIVNNEMGVPFTARILLLGWGVKKTSQKLSYEPIFLQSKEIPVYPNKFCQEVYGKKFITETMFCAGTLTTGEGACDHDAGGPAVLNGKLVGIISFGPTICGFPDAPTVFTLVGAFADWIETVNETMPGYYRSNQKTTTTTEDPLVRYFFTATNKQVSTHNVTSPGQEIGAAKVEVQELEAAKDEGQEPVEQETTKDEVNDKEVTEVTEEGGDVTSPTTEADTSTVATVKKNIARLARISHVHEYKIKPVDSKEKKKKKHKKMKKEKEMKRHKHHHKADSRRSKKKIH